tara:strand:+ start:204 stop:371 length:168 start_codon:yes stop_codon:yes gene_type:complete
MNLSYLTDAQVRAEMVKLLERIDSKYWTEDDCTYEGGISIFWKDLGYSYEEVPRL